MSEPQTSTRSGDWLTVSQAAAALGISERAVQKRCASGKLAARRVETPQGTRWEIDANQITRTVTRTSEPNARTLDANQDANQRTKSPEPRELTHEIGREPANHQDANHANRQNDFQAHLLEENRFLRTLIEQRDRDAAELRAALRKALDSVPKALPESTSSTRDESGENAPQLAQMPQTGKQSPETKKDTQSGLRGEGLRDLRAIFKKILGVR